MRPDGVPLQEAAADLLRQLEQEPARAAGEPLRPSDELRILVMVREQGATQEDAAAAVGCHQSTVSRVLAKYDDTRPLARKRLEAAALEVAERAIRDGDPLKLLAKLDVLREDREAVERPTVQVLIGIPPPGTPGNPIPIRARHSTGDAIDVAPLRPS
jgi:hypothetical protein